MTKLTPKMINEIGCDTCIDFNRYRYALIGTALFQDEPTKKKMHRMVDALYRLETEFIVELLNASDTIHIEDLQRRVERAIARADSLNRSLPLRTHPDEVFGEMEEGTRWPRLAEFADVIHRTRWEVPLEEPDDIPQVFPDQLISETPCDSPERTEDDFENPF
jgi:hypothetical protein